MALYSIRNMLHNLISEKLSFVNVSSAQTCLNCPDRVTGGAKTSTHNVNYVKAMTEYVTMTRTELISAPASWTHCVFPYGFSNIPF